MGNFKDLQLNAVDYILVVDKNYNLIFNTRYESCVNDSAQTKEKAEYLKKSFFEVYPHIERTKSTVVECMTTGKVVVRKVQVVTDYKGKSIKSANVTIPIIRKGQLMGVVELAKDITTAEFERNVCYSNNEFNELAEKVKFAVENITFESIITHNSVMLENIETAKMLSRLQSPILVYGETGTGKEMFVQAIINYTGISRKKVVIQNCAAVPDNLIESILFGTTKGAYTGAENTKGLFEQADGGIVFLDELSSMPYGVQGKLLRVLQDGTFRPLGSNTEKRVNVKVIAAMNEDPLTAIENKTLRKDLFYRLNSHMIYLLPLRDRPEDIDYYMEYFLAEFNKEYGKNIIGIESSLRDMLRKYTWEGNVREFRHLIESMVSISDEDILKVKNLPAYIYKRMTGAEEKETREKIQMPFGKLDWNDEKDFDLRRVLNRREKELILEALAHTNGNKTEASKLLGIPRQTLNYKLKMLENQE